MVQARTVEGKAISLGVTRNGRLAGMHLPIWYAAWEYECCGPSLEPGAELSVNLVLEGFTAEPADRGQPLGWRATASGAVEFVADLGRREPYPRADFGGISSAVDGPVQTGRFQGTGLLWHRAHEDFGIGEPYRVVVRRLCCARQILRRTDPHTIEVTGHERPTEISGADDCPPHADFVLMAEVVGHGR
ncbi:hypothetical protein [Actinomadura kijaniata]|uniref:hypothetical protein n=1 Tax=Actinomadura kijaniata TaxID=46161 RepID=UPI000AFFD1D7|nr:hypothetical protein [Actinomadura kijaniata]